MTQKNKLRETLRFFLPTFLALLAPTGAMVGVFALIGRLTQKVWLGAALGTALSMLNFVAMVVLLLRAEKAETPAKGQLASGGSYVIRMAILAAALVVALKSDCFDPVATLLPLVFFRIAIMLSELFRKKGACDK